MTDKHKVVNKNVTAQSTEQQSKQFEKQIIDSIFSKSLGESRDFWVKLPEKYKPDSEEKYAVIYLLDGFSLKKTLEAVYDNYWGHYLPHMILVGVSNLEYVITLRSDTISGRILKDV